MRKVCRLQAKQASCSRALFIIDLGPPEGRDDVDPDYGGNRNAIDDEVTVPPCHRVQPGRSLRPNGFKRRHPRGSFKCV
jgi:hypothetical protein